MHRTHKNSLANLVPWQAGQTGNPGGKLHGFGRALRDLLRKREFLGEPTPDGKTMEQVLAEVCLAKALKGNDRALDQVVNHAYGPKGELTLANGNRVVFNIIPNGRDDTPPEIPDCDNSAPARASAVDTAALAGEAPAGDAGNEDKSDKPGEMNTDATPSSVHENTRK